MDNNKEPEILNLVFNGISLHVSEPRKPISPVRAMEKSLRNKKPGRWFKKILPGTGENENFPSTPLFDGYAIAYHMAKAKAEGKEFRISFPTVIYAGKDVLEYEAAKKRKAFDKARK